MFFVEMGDSYFDISFLTLVLHMWHWYCTIVLRMWVLSKYCCYCQVSSGIAGYHEVSKKHLDDPVPNGDYPVHHCLGIGSSVSGIRLYCIGNYMSKFQLKPNILCLVTNATYWQKQQLTAR